MRGLWVGPSYGPSDVDRIPPVEVDLANIAVEADAEACHAFGIDLTYLTPAIVRDATILGLGIWTIWPAGDTSTSGRRDARNATDIALTLRQPAGSAIYFADPPEDAEPDYWQTVAKVLEARGFGFGYHGLMPPRQADYIWATVRRAHIVTGPRHPLGILCAVNRPAGVWNLTGAIKPRRRLLSRSA